MRFRNYFLPILLLAYPDHTLKHAVDALDEQDCILVYFGLHLTQNALPYFLFQLVAYIPEIRRLALDFPVSEVA